MPVKITTPWLRKLLLINLLIIALAHFVFVSLELYTTIGLESLTPLLDLDSEGNIPTFYNSLLFMATGVSAWKVRSKVQSRPRKVFWTGAALFFIYWAFDEALALHERLAEPIRELLQLGYQSPFYHAWVVVAMALIALVGLVILLVPRIRSKPLAKREYNLLLTIIVMMCGIVLLEIFGTRVYDNQAVYRLVAIPLEELFEIFMASYLLLKVIGYQTSHAIIRP